MTITCKRRHLRKGDSAESQKDRSQWQKKGGKGTRNVRQTKKVFSAGTVKKKKKICQVGLRPKAKEQKKRSRGNAEAQEKRTNGKGKKEEDKLNWNKKSQAPKEKRFKEVRRGRRQLRANEKKKTKENYSVRKKKKNRGEKTLRNGESPLLSKGS